MTSIKRSITISVVSLIVIAMAIFVLITRSSITGIQGSRGIIGKTGTQGIPGETGPQGKPFVIMTAAKLGTSVQNDGDWGPDFQFVVTAASCVEKEVQPSGIGRYRCTIDLKYTGSPNPYIESTHRQARDIIVGRDGGWATDGPVS